MQNEIKYKIYTHLSSPFHHSRDCRIHRERVCLRLGVCVCALSRSCGANNEKKIHCRLFYNRSRVLSSALRSRVPIISSLFFIGE